jgi:hypothetical protein
VLPNGVEIVLRVLAIPLGLWIVGGTFLSAIKLVVIPRGTSQRITRFVFVMVRRIIETFGHERQDFLTRDKWLSMYAPVALIMMPIVWLALLTLGFGFLHWAAVGRAFTDAILVSGSSMLTLGVAFNRSIPDAMISFVQAATGIVVGALLISYLPTLYQSYQRREALVGMLESRAGIPPSPHEVLVRYQRIFALDYIEEDLFLRWEQWFIEVEESHTAVAALVFFRSPRPERSWITAGGAVLDTAAIYLSCVDRPFSGRAALSLRTGFLALRRIADYFGLPYDPNPKPTDPISVTRREFDLMLVELEAAGVPLKADREKAWRDFAGWRVNYDTVLVSLAHLIVAPEGRWSSDRQGTRMLPQAWRRGGVARLKPARSSRKK